LREKGNKLYQAKKFPSAVHRYTKSAQFAPVGSESLALAFANRSAVLFQMKEYAKCIEDIGYSLEAGYPEVSRYKLVERKIKCLIFMEQVTGTKVLAFRVLKERNHV
jgi:hypothetical protein